jgi:glycine dehydrogenase subunit 1
MIASLLGMEIANASNYDGSTALAEAALMAIRLQKKKKVILAKSIHPEYRQVVKTTLRNLGDEIVEVGWDEAGCVDQKELSALLSEETSALCVQSPNFFGVVEDVGRLSQTAHNREALLVSGTGDAVSLGLLASPGSCGADIAVGEGQSFGNFLNFGGPYLGLFATKKEFVRQMPGRLAGETVDPQGNRGFILTLNTREQHIRRERATSNICTNQSLCALAAAIHLSLLGPSGLKRLAEINFAKAQYAQRILSQIPGVKKIFGGETFNEFAVRLPRPVKGVLAALQQKKIFGGFALEHFYPELKNGLLVCVTEMNS